MFYKPGLSNDMRELYPQIITSIHLVIKEWTRGGLCKVRNSQL